MYVIYDIMTIWIVEQFSSLAGLCQSGAWGCFDEFNRIEISVISVISTQLQTIRNALVKKLATFHVSIEGIHYCQL